MKMNNKIIKAVLATMVILLALPLQALAAGRIDQNRDVSLTISYQDGKTPLVGAQFDLYLVATMDETGALTVTQTFEKYSIDLTGNDDAAWKAMASTLEGYVLRDSVTPTDSGKTDRNGKLSFPAGSGKLAPGLYLILGSRHRQNGVIYDAQPTMALLPVLDKETDEWHYDVTISTKHESHLEPSNPDDDTVTRKVLKIWDDEGNENRRPKEITVQLLRDGKVYDTVTLNEANNWRYTWTDLSSEYKWIVVEKELENYTVTVTQAGITFVVTNTYKENTPEKPTTPTTPSTPSEPTLPQTGQLWWPVPILIAAGLLLVVIGLLRRRGAGYEE